MYSQLLTLTVVWWKYNYVHFVDRTPRCWGTFLTRGLLIAIGGDFELIWSHVDTYYVEPLDGGTTYKQIFISVSGMFLPCIRENHSLSGLEASLIAQLVNNLPAVQEIPVRFLKSGRSTGEGIGYPLQYSWASLVAQLVKNLPGMWETWVWSPREGKIPWRRESLTTPVFWPGEFHGNTSWGCRVRHDVWLKQ